MPEPVQLIEARIMAERMEREKKISLLVASAGFVVSLPPLISMAAERFPWIRYGVSFVLNLLSNYWAQCVLLSFVIAAGWFAHWYKRRNQYRYGAIEVAFASSSAFNVIWFTDVRHALSSWASLIGAVYVISRGLSNMSEAKKKSLLEP